MKQFPHKLIQILIQYIELIGHKPIHEHKNGLPPTL